MRFRKVFRLFPGLKVNLTPNGLSTTVGEGPLSINAGSHGVYANVHVPGTPLWDREKLAGAPAAQRDEPQPQMPVFKCPCGCVHALSDAFCPQCRMWRLATFDQDLLTMVHSGVPAVEAMTMIHTGVIQALATVGDDISFDEHLSLRLYMTDVLSFIKQNLEYELAEPEDNPNIQFVSELHATIVQMLHDIEEKQIQWLQDSMNNAQDDFARYVTLTQKVAQQSLRRFQ